MNSARLQAAKTLLTAHIAHNYTYNKLYSTRSRIQTCIFCLSKKFFKNLKCIWFCCCSYFIGFWLKYCVLGSDHPRDLLHNQNLSLILNVSTFLDVQMHKRLDACLYAYSFQLPSMGKSCRDILLAGIGGIRACGRTAGSIPLGLASASSHSALVSLGLYTVNTPSLVSWHH